MGQQATSGKQQPQAAQKGTNSPSGGGSFFQGCRQGQDQEVETVEALGVRSSRGGPSHDFDDFPYSNNHVGGPLRGPVSEVGSISGLSKSSRGSARRRDYDDDDAASVTSQRMRAEQNWIETENDKVAYLRRVQERVGNRRGPGSDGGYSDATHDRHRGKSHRSGRHGGHGSDWDARSETQSDWSAPRSHRSASSHRSRGSASSAYPPSAGGYGRPHDRRDRHGDGHGHPDKYALRDRDDHRHYHDDRSHGSHGSYGARRAEGMQIEPASRVPGLAVHREDMITSDLEAKLKNEKRRVEEAVEQSRLQEARARQAENQLKEAETKTGGVDMKYQLMGEIVNIRDRLLGVDKLKTEAEQKAMQIAETLRNEEERRETAERNRDDLEAEKMDLTTERDSLKAKVVAEHDYHTILVAEQQKLERELQMIAKERDETLELLERAVKQKETLKRGKQDETQRAATELEKMRLEQQHDQHEVRDLLKSVDHLLAKFNRSETRSSDASTAATNDLILIRDSVRKLVKANPDGGRKG